MLAAFLVVFFFLARFGFPVIIKMVDERKRYIDDSLSKAHEAAERLLNIKQEGEALIQEAQEQQAKIMKEAAETRDAIVEKAEEKARQESARIIAEAKQQIAFEKQEAIRDIRSQVAELSVNIAEKILREELSSEKAQQANIDRLLDEVCK